MFRPLTIGNIVINWKLACDRLDVTMLNWLVTKGRIVQCTFESLPAYDARLEYASERLRILQYGGH